MRVLTNRIGPFKLYAAHDVVSCLSRAAVNVRVVETSSGAFVAFDLPEGAPMWRLA